MTQKNFPTELNEACAVTTQTRADGSLILRRREPLGDYPAHLGQRIAHWARHAPGRSFVARRAAGGAWRHVTFAQTLDRARSLGQALLERGLSAERPLLILSENDLEHAMLAAAALYAGVPYAPVSPAYSLVSQDFGKLRHIVSLLTPGLVYAADGERYGAAIAAAVAAQIELAVGVRPPDGRHATLFEDLVATAATSAVDAAHARITPDATAKFLFTSGSTQAPKAVINTQRMLCSNQQMILQALPFLADEPPVLVDWLPWNHTFGGNHNWGLALYNGGTLYIDDGKPVQPLMHETLRNLREISPTIYFNVPKGYEELVQALETDAGLRECFFRRLRGMMYGGASLPPPVAAQLSAVAQRHCAVPVAISTGFGMTETAPLAIGMAPVGKLPGVIGNPVPGVTLKLVPWEGRFELCYRGDCVTPGYWRAPQLTADAFDDEGFFRSGDAVRFVDRKDPGQGLIFDGRIAEDFKLSTGTWVGVGALRAQALIEGAPNLLDVVVTGHDRDEIGLLIFPRLEACRALAGSAPAASDAEIVRSPAVRAFFQSMIDRLAARATGSAGRVARASILPQPPSIDLGEVTDKGSINQRAVLAHRADAVGALYAGGADVLLASPVTSKRT